MKLSKTKRATSKTANSQGVSSPLNGDEYRQNFSRSINVFGTIDAELVKKLTPEILRLRSEGPSEAITVYIDSPGGAIESYKHLECLLFAPDQDGRTCRIITVATAYAASAAARLLVRGDYSMAYKNAIIHCHGVRYQGISVVTKERAESMSESLASFNDEMAGDFVQKIIENLCWLYNFHVRDISPQHPKENESAPNDIAFLSVVIGDNLGSNSPIIETVIDELNQVSELDAFLKCRAQKTRLEAAEKKNRATKDTQLMKCILDFVGRTRTDEEKKGGLTKTSITEVLFLYSLRRSYYEKFFADCEDPQPLLMLLCDKETLTAVAKLDNEKRTDMLLKSGGPALFSCWQLSSTIASRLVKGENSLTAGDAYWLGLINEVIGDDSLPSRRSFAEKSGLAA